MLGFNCDGWTMCDVGAVWLKGTGSHPLVARTRADSSGQSEALSRVSE